MEKVLAEGIVKPCGKYRVGASTNTASVAMHRLRINKNDFAARKGYRVRSIILGEFSLMAIKDENGILMAGD